MEKLHADQSLLIVTLEFEVTVDFAVVRLDEFALIVAARTDAERVATVGVTVVESLAIPILSVSLYRCGNEI